MKTRIWHLCRDDGTFTGDVRCYDDAPGIAEFVQASTPPGLRALEVDVTDWQSQRVENGEVVDCLPPKPDDDHEWVEDDEGGNPVRRWMLKRKVERKRARRDRNRGERRELEQQSFMPLIAEVLGKGDAQSRKELSDIYARMLKLRDDDNKEDDEGQT